jgi:RHH-type transcriptional regulator, proline utilization regulon repressor / proline dehydrogenase / delta 1-pyrroline-5-carboxylate dehydrogenase
MNAPNPFAQFAPPLAEQSPLRSAITRATRRPETECLPPLISAAKQSADMRQKINITARQLVETLRATPAKGGVQGLVQEYSLSSQEGVALMCLAEALLRIPDDATRDALIRDKIAGGDWGSHIGFGRSLFVNAATWGLVVTGKLTSTVNDAGLGSTLTRLIGRLGEPVIRASVDMAMRLMGEQFVTGQTIDEALANCAKREAKGYRFSFDMLGEAATTQEDASRYYASYENAIHAIGKAAAGGGPYESNGISIKLSALHPRYARVQAARVLSELLPRVIELAKLAKSYNIGFNIDAEEADRLELSLDLLEALCFDAELEGWNGLGSVVQAYGRRCPFVLDFIIDLAKRSNRRIMVRLVKGAYWDSEIKRAQVDGLSDYPVFTRKLYTDVSYTACARKLLDARALVFPQFATHNAQTLATIYHMAGPNFTFGDYEFQCLHGMGEPLYDQVVGAAGLNRPCRIYAPVGTHETLLAYLVRRLLENGANSSFVHRSADHRIAVSDLIEDPAEVALAMPIIGAPHEKIAAPDTIFGSRLNSRGLDLADENSLNNLDVDLQASANKTWHAKPLIAGKQSEGIVRNICNPGNVQDKVGDVVEPQISDVVSAMGAASAGWPVWAQTPVAQRAEKLEWAADIMQSRITTLMGLTMREAGKSAANAIAEVREAIDFLRYYASEARGNLASAEGLGVVVCISPWNFPLAIFAGQIAAALAAGNSVIAKPAEETPLIAYEAVRILHEAGVPQEVLQFLPGDGAIGAALVAAKETAAVMFTGSTEVARLINMTLAKRLSSAGKPISLIAETGGQNAMIVDSSALAEQVVGDVITSAFDSAGQRCSALRVLCLQDDIAVRVLAMIKGAMRELCVGNTTALATDVGPVISADAKRIIDMHVETMQKRGCDVYRQPLGAQTAHGNFVAPTIIEINSLHELEREVFGPVLHVLRYKREQLDELIDAINDTGYGLTFGLHTRLDETIEHVTRRIKAGNLYINRNTIGAVVGIQPFGGTGLSGTGPKAGGPLYLHRLTNNPVPVLPVGEMELNGPVGERNLYALHPRGRVLCIAQTPEGLAAQKRIAAETGNECVVAEVGWESKGPYATALIEAEGAALIGYLQSLAAMPGPIITAQVAPYCKAWLMEEKSISINTTASGGNASLMTIG